MKPEIKNSILTRSYVFEKDIEMIYRTVKSIMTDQEPGFAQTISEFIENRRLDYDDVRVILADANIIYNLDTPNPRMLLEGFIHQRLVCENKPNNRNVATYPYLLTKRGELFLSILLDYIKYC